MKLKLGLGLLFILSFQTAHCQQKLIGRVVDSNSQKPIKKALIKTDGIDSLTSTNFLGYFEIQGDSIDLTISHPDYYSVEVKLTQPNIVIPIPPIANILPSLELIDSISIDRFFMYYEVDWKEALSQEIENNERALFPGDISNFHLFLIDSLFFTHKKQLTEEFNSIVEFDITEKGKIVVTNIINPPTNQQLIINAFSNCPRWMAAKRNKVNVSSKYRQQLIYKPSVEIFAPVDQQPKYKGGFMAFYKMLGKNINYPELAKKNKVDGKVLVSFVVNQEGEIEEVETTEGIGFGCDEEAERLIKLSSGNWDSGSQRGRPVKVRMKMPIKFNREGKVL